MQIFKMKPWSNIYKHILGQNFRRGRVGEEEKMIKEEEGGGEENFMGKKKEEKE